MRDFDSFTVEDMSASTMMKWTMFPDTIGMWLAEMDFGIADELVDFISSQASQGSMGYLPSSEQQEILAATSSFIGRTSGWYPDSHRMSLLPDVLTGLHMAIEEFTRPGSAVVVPTPAYMPFLTIPRQHGREVIEVPSIFGDDGLWYFDYDGIEAAFEAGAGMFVLCNPWNPAGRSLTRAELEKLANLVNQYDVRVFEDGIHAPLILDGAEAVPFATVSEGAAEHTLTAVAASKGWNIPGLKCAQLVVNNDSDWQLFEKVGQAYTGATSTLGARAARVAFEHCAPWNESVRRYIASTRDFIEETVASWPGVRLAHIEATYIGFLDFSAPAEAGLFAGQSPAAWLRKNVGVSFTEGKLCGTGYENWVRMTFANSKPVVAQALSRIEKALAAGSFA